MGTRGRVVGLQQGLAVTEDSDGKILRLQLSSSAGAFAVASLGSLASSTSQSSES